MDISVVIPVLYKHHLTDICLNSILKKHDLNKINLECIIINNECDPETSKLIEKYNNLNIVEIKEPKNLGVSASWNRGIEHSSFDKIAIINNDIEFGFSNSLYEMGKTIESNPDIYWTSPITYYERNQKTITSFRISHYEQLKYGASGNNYVVGCCFMCPKISFNTIGMFDEKIAVRYYEDLDYINRILQAGKRLKMTERAAVYHAVGSTSRFVKGGEENEKYYQEKWANSPFDILKKQGNRKKGIRHFD